MKDDFETSTSHLKPPVYYTGKKATYVPGVFERLIGSIILAITYTCLTIAKIIELEVAFIVTGVAGGIATAWVVFCAKVVYCVVTMTPLRLLDDPIVIAIVAIGALVSGVVAIVSVTRGHDIFEHGYRHVSWGLFEDWL